MRHIKLRPKNNFFTLFEIVLCVAILGMIGAFLGWQIKTMVSCQHFHKNIDMLLCDLRKLQIIALSHRADIEMKITEKEGKYSYQVLSDEPLEILEKKQVKLLGIKRIEKNKVPIKKILTLKVYSSGRIEPAEEIKLFQEDDSGAIITPGTTIGLKLFHAPV